MNDKPTKSQKIPFDVIPAKAGIQSNQSARIVLDPGFHRGDDFLLNHLIRKELNF
jgi:hypothetical protein